MERPILSKLSESARQAEIVTGGNKSFLDEGSSIKPETSNAPPDTDTGTTQLLPRLVWILWTIGLLALICATRQAVGIESRIQRLYARRLALVHGSIFYGNWRDSFTARASRLSLFLSLYLPSLSPTFSGCF